MPREYPVVEAATAFLSLVTVAVLGPTTAALAACLLLWALVPVAWLDWREHVIPDVASVPLFLAGLLASPFEPDAWSRGAGGALAMGLFWVAFKLVSAAKSVDAMALGDVALAGAMGAWLGVCSVPAYVGLSAAVYVAYAAPLRIRGGRVWVPMGPALAAAAMLVAAGGSLRGVWS